MSSSSFITKKRLKAAYNRLRKYTRRFSNLVVRDTTDFLDFEIEKDKYLKQLAFLINNGKYQPQKPYLHASPKNKGINRPTVVLSIEDSIVYRLCIESIQDEIIDKTRLENIRGGVKITAFKTTAGDFEYEEWFKDWLDHLGSVENRLRCKKYAVVTDIASYFENINILILNDQIRSDVKGKKQILDLLFFLLQSTKIRNGYEVNSYNGLLQESIDCSRQLAYYFLHQHDRRMINFCKNYNGEFYRFVDDMIILVNSEVEGKNALKCLTESLRKLGLVAGIEKTDIWTSLKAKQEFYFKENKRISNYEDKIIKGILGNYSYKRITNSAEKYYDKLKSDKLTKKNWIKILKRFYTIFTYAQSNRLLDDLIDDTIKHPILWTNNKLPKYLLRNQSSCKFDKVINKLIKYLYSEENLYPLLESNVLEFFLSINDNRLKAITKRQLKKLAENVFFKNNFEPQSDYSRALACLLFYKYDNENIEKLANHYIKSTENDNILKKYLIFVSLTVGNQKLRQQIFSKSKKEQDFSINRLVSFLENIKSYKGDNFNKINSYCKKDDIYIYKNERHKFQITEKFINIRGQILEELIKIYK